MVVQENLFDGVLRSLRRHIGTAILIVAAACALTTLVSRFDPPLYESEIILRVMASDLAAGESVTSIINGILAQKNIFSEVLHTCGIDSSSQPSYNPFVIEEIGRGLIKLKVRDPNPGLIPELGDAAVRVLSSKFLGYSGAADDFEIETLEKKKTILSANLNEARKSLLEANRAAVFPGAPESIEEEMQVLGAKIEEDNKRLQSLPRIRVIPSDATDQALAETSKELAEAKAVLNRLFETYREKHPKVIAAKERIASLQKRQRTLATQKDKKEPNPEFETLQQEIERNKIRLEELKNQWLESNRTPNFIGQAALAPEPPAAIESRIKSLENIYNETLMRIEELRIQKSAAVGRVQVLRKDSEPPKPSGLSLFQRQIAALFSGALLAVILLYTPTPLKAELVMPSEIATPPMLQIPGNQADNQTARLLEMHPLSSARLALPIPDSIQHAAYDERLIVLNEPDSKRLEPYKALTANLQIALADSKVRIVQICSSRAGMGRSTLTANLAVLFAQAGYSTVVIDANLRRPILHRIFDTENDEGLSTALLGGRPKQLVKQTMIKNLGIITAGPIPPSPPELLGSVAMIELLASLKRRVEVVLIDTPALLEYPDAGIMAGQAGGVVFLHREGEPEADLKAGREMLKNVRANILGFVTI